MARTKTPTFAVPALSGDHGTRIGQLQDLIDRANEAIVDAVLEGRAQGKTWAELRTASGMRRSKMQRMIGELRGDDVLQTAIDGVEVVRPVTKKAEPKKAAKAPAAKASKTAPKKATAKKTVAKAPAKRARKNVA